MTITIESSEQPPAHDRYKKYNNSDKGKGRKNGYRRKVSEENYLTKPFVAWDGEGGNEDDGSHTYFILASSRGATLTRRNGLGTREVFDLWLEQDRNATHIIFGGNYDFNMILKDLPKESLWDLYKTDHTVWQGYYIEWRPGKYLYVKKGEKRFRVYDVLPFFQKSFVAACDEYLGTKWPYRDEIIAGKAKRGSFDWSELDDIARYNVAELENLVNLANELRSRLHRVGIRVSRWDGPGAIASSLFKTYETKSYFGEVPEEVAAAGRHAYAGGRFEIIRKGHSRYAAYQYDINSAYPYAIAMLPCLAHGKWRHVVRPTEVEKFGVYKIEYNGLMIPDNFDPSKRPTWHENQPHPFFMRFPNGAVSFPMYAYGWYWSPEATMVKHYENAEIHEGWVWDQECDHEPFSWVEALYKKRAALKKAGDGAHIGIKLGLNSLYGKLAQQVGWSIGKNGELKIPPYHCLEWAGWITSLCRMKVFEACLQAPDDVIAFETDAVFTRVPLDLPCSSNLGDWELTEYDSLTYIKSGMYYGTLRYSPGRGKSKEVEKFRGVNKGSVPKDKAVEMVKLNLPIMAEQTRFVGLGQALHQNMDLWRRWVTSPRVITMQLNGKRRDLAGTGIPSNTLTKDGWKETYPVQSPVNFSQPYDVEWINPLAANWEKVDERWDDNGRE